MFTLITSQGPSLQATFERHKLHFSQLNTSNQSKIPNQLEPTHIEKNCFQIIKLVQLIYSVILNIVFVKSVIILVNAFLNKAEHMYLQLFTLSLA